MGVGLDSLRFFLRASANTSDVLYFFAFNIYILFKGDIDDVNIIYRKSTRAGGLYAR